MIKSVRDDKNNYLFFRHVIISCQDEDKIRQKYSMSKVLRTIQVQTESFLMILIQTHILCHTFQADREESWAQFCLAMISILNLARDCAEHHFHEISGEYLLLLYSKNMFSTNQNLFHLQERVSFHFVTKFFQLCYSEITIKIFEEKIMLMS